jgi:hypothetical protein
VIRTNLATQPDDARRPGGRLRLAVAAAIVATALNGLAAVHYIRSDTELAAQAARDESRAAELRRAAAGVRNAMTADDTGRLSADAAQASALVARRVFSWTDLFNRFEETLPAGVRLTAVRPGVGGSGGVLLEVSVIARSVDDLDAFLRSLEGTGVFQRVMSRDERRNDQGQIEALIEAAYTPRDRPGGGGSGTP